MNLIYSYSKIANSYFKFKFEIQCLKPQSKSEFPIKICDFTQN